MASRDIEFRVGIIIIIGIIMLGGSLYWLRDYQLERNAQVIRVRFADVGTLEVGDKVTVSGVRAGKVSDLKLAEGGVEVELLLSREVVLKRDAVIAIRNLGLMGERFISIEPGRDTALFDASIVADGTYDTGLPEVMGLMGEMIVELRSLVGSFKKTIGSDSSLAKFNNTVANLESVSSSLADYMKRNESRLDRTADNFYRASQELNRMLSQNSPKMDSATARVDRITVKMEDFVGQLDSLSHSFRQFARQLENPDGTLQLLIEDRRLYDDLRRTADNIDDLVTDIRANPGKYINLKLELF
ncbi:MAG: MCE family protein [Candidatus Zixiibacteriota bacterium]|nr:MAG: MCE family protein [candidate division Zixibacteria bacterium]